MRLLDIAQLDRILDGFGTSGRRRLVENRDGVVQRVHQCAAGVLAVKLYRHIVQAGEIQRDVVIGEAVNVVADQRLADHQIHRGELDENAQLPLRQHDIRQLYRIIRNVVAAQVEQPFNVVQTGQNQPVRAGLLKRLPQLLDLVGAGLSGVFVIQQPRGLMGARRAILPNFINQINICAEGDGTLAQTALEHVQPVGSDGASVKTEALSVLQGIRQILHQCGDTRFTHAVERNTRALQLLGGLEEVPSIRPKTGGVRGDDNRTGRAGKAGDPLAAAEVFADVFRTVEIVGGDIIDINVIGRHVLAQGSQSLWNRHNALFFLHRITVF